ncbi:unnamed protein product, partial [Thlaspi arvense]
TTIELLSIDETHAILFEFLALFTFLPRKKGMMLTGKTKPKPGCCRNVTVWFRSSRWRKASNKQLIQNLLCSVKVQRRRRECMARQSTSDIAQLLPNGRFPEALPKAKYFYEDEKRLSAYDQVEYFCTSILRNFSPINHQSDVLLLPKEAKEAMAGLVFAASRIGELKELQSIRSLFVQRFGLQFDKDCVDLRPGNVVNPEIVNILDTNMPEDAITPEILTEISHKYEIKITTSVDSSEVSAFSENIGVAKSEAVKIEKPKTRKKPMKEKSKFLHSSLGVSEGRDRSSFMR